MARRRIFTVRTPLGYWVFLTRDRWRSIIRIKHPALDGSEAELRACLAAPSMIRESAKDSDVHLYYKPVEQNHLCVVVAPADSEERFVVTAYFTSNIKMGKPLWSR